MALLFMPQTVSSHIYNCDLVVAGVLIILINVPLSRFFGNFFSFLWNPTWRYLCVCYLKNIKYYLRFISWKLFWDFLWLWFFFHKVIGFFVITVICIKINTLMLSTKLCAKFFLFLGSSRLILVKFLKEFVVEWWVYVISHASFCIKVVQVCMK